MPAFFTHRRGAVSRVTSQYSTVGGLLPFRIVSDELDMTSPITRAIITQAAVREAGNFQFLHTLNETIYAYVFGDRIGELQLSGICFLDSCDAFGFPNPVQVTDGAEQIVQNYRRNRIANANGPVRLSIGATDYLAFLVGMSLDVADAERNLGQWTFRFNTFPGHTQ